MHRRRHLTARNALGLALVSLATACSADATPPTTLDAGSDAQPPVDAGIDAFSDGGAVTPCPTTGKGAISAPDVTCIIATPAQTGAGASGENAGTSSYALAPNANRKDQLVVFLNGSGGHPQGTIADPTQSFFTAATALGDSVIGLSYASAKAVGLLCTTDGCFGPTRETIVRGVFQTGASAQLQSIQTDEGIVPRLALLLRWLAANDPAHGWSAFLTPGSEGKPADQQLVWSKITAAGHSQGGGHAAMMGKLFPLARVIQLSSTCDQIGGVPASWTKGASGTWLSVPADFFGLAAPTTFTGNTPSSGDLLCPYHAAVWQNLGMIPARSNDAAATCAIQGDTHSASIQCKDNFGAWQAMLK